MNALEFLVSEFDVVTIKLTPGTGGRCVASINVGDRFTASLALPAHEAIAQAANMAVERYRERRVNEIEYAKRALARAEDVEAE